MTTLQPAPLHLSTMCGGVAGVVSTAVTNPLDVMRTRMQASVESAQKHGQKRLLQTAKKMWQDGFRRGWGTALPTNLAVSLCSRSVYLGTYTAAKGVLKKSSTLPSWFVSTGGACCAVTATCVLLAPLFTVRVRVQLNPELRFPQVARDVFAKEGLAGFWRGCLTGVIGRSVEGSLFFCIYESMKRTFQNGGNDPSMGRVATAAGQFFGLSMLSKMVACSIAYPHMVIQTHLREIHPDTCKHEYSGIYPTSKHIFRKQGVKGFFSGIGPHLVRTPLSTGIAFTVWETLLYYQGYNT